MKPRTIDGIMTRKWRCRSFSYLLLLGFLIGGVNEVRGAVTDSTTVWLGFAIGTNGWYGDFMPNLGRGLNLDIASRFSFSGRWSWGLSVGYQSMKAENTKKMVGENQEIALYCAPIAVDLFYDFSRQDPVYILHGSFGVQYYKLKAAQSEVGMGKSIFFGAGLGCRASHGLFSMEVMCSYLLDLSTTIPSQNGTILAIIKIGTSIPFVLAE
jgi:hypothetical protein